jgi:WXXGXW repeat (2 copies)
VSRLRNAALAGMLLGSFVLCGCGGGVDYYGGVGYGPPAPLVEEPYGVAPAPDYIWTPGYYDWDGGVWAWRGGSWRRRPHPDDRWVGPRWERRGSGYRYHGGGWQHGDHFHH